MTTSMPLPSDWRARLAAIPDAPIAGRNRHLFPELNQDNEFSPILMGRKPVLRPAAVMIPVIERAEGPYVLFMVRPKTMPSHAGEIGLPGGGIQPEDGGAVGGALRETEEEIGVTADLIEVSGQLGVHIGGFGFAVTPVVGVLAPTSQIIPCDREVAEVFEVPLAFIVDQQNHLVETRSFNGIDYRMFAMPYREPSGVERHIWGLTAGILESFRRAFWGEDLPAAGLNAAAGVKL